MELVRCGPGWWKDPLVEDFYFRPRRAKGTPRECMGSGRVLAYLDGGYLAVLGTGQDKRFKDVGDAKAWVVRNAEQQLLIW